MPFLPVMPVCKYCAVYNLHFPAHHGMEEVVGSIPTRSTNKSNNLAKRQEKARYAKDTLVLKPHLLRHSQAVKCRDMVYSLSPDILYSFPMPG
jgi:hypothetical protein